MDKLKKFEDNDHRVVILTGAPVASAGQLNTSSLARLAERVKELLADPAALAGKKELIVAGPWTFSKDGMRIIEAKFGQLEIDTAAEDVEADEVRTGDLTRARSHSNAAQKGKADLKKHELEWSIAVNFIKQVLQKITDLQSFEWESDVPFSKELWPLVNPSLQHLTLNAFVPDGDTRTAHEPHPDYFTYDDLNHLCSFRSLKSLRIYGLVDSVQPIIWETAWRNPGLHTLELGMLLPPITRATDNKPMEVIDREWKFDPEHIGTTIYRTVQACCTISMAMENTSIRFLSVRLVPLSLLASWATSTLSPSRRFAWRISSSTICLSRSSSISSRSLSSSKSVAMLASLSTSTCATKFASSPAPRATVRLRRARSLSSSTSPRRLSRTTRAAVNGDPCMNGNPEIVDGRIERRVSDGDECG